MSGKYRKILEVFGLRSRSPPPRVFVSLNVFDAHRPHHSSHLSARVIVRLSIWSLLVLLLAFMIVYTFILLYVDNIFLQSSSARIHGKYRKMKLTGRHRIHYNKQKGLAFKELDEHIDAIHRKAVWNSSKFYNEDMNLPQCKLQTLLRILISSAPTSKLRRQAIRSTWCKPDNFNASYTNWHCIFLIGWSKDEKVNTELRKESAEHKDLLIGNYFDAYENLTLKVIHGFNWSVNYCQSSFVLKTDDDCFVNGALLHDFLLHYNNVTTNLYAGKVHIEKRMLKVVRQKTQKWYVPYSDFAEEYYYPYASGMGYIVSKDVAEKIVQESAFTKPIVNEDAYIGIVIHGLGIEPTRSDRFVLSPLKLSICNHRYLFLIHDVPPEKQKDVLSNTLRAKTECNHHSTFKAWR